MGLVAGSALTVMGPCGSEAAAGVVVIAGTVGSDNIGVGEGDADVGGG